MRTSYLIASALLIAAACTSGTVDSDQRYPTARERLTKTVPMMSVLPQSSAATLSLSYGAPSSAIDVEIGYGFVELSANTLGELVVESVDVELGSVAAGDKGLPPSGIMLRDLHLVTDTRHPCDAVAWEADGESCEASASVSLSLEGEMRVSDGQWLSLAIPVASQMDIFVYRGPSASLGAEIAASGAGRDEARSIPVGVDYLQLDLELSEALFVGPQGSAPRY